MITQLLTSNLSCLAHYQTSQILLCEIAKESIAQNHSQGECRAAYSLTG